MRTKSEIAEYIKLSSEPVAIIKSDACPDGAIQYKEGRWGCVIALLNAASKGKVAAMSDKTTTCPGGKVGTGFGSFKTGTIEYFISVGGKGPKPGEFYKESPELALNYIETLPVTESKEYLLFKPLSAVNDEDKVETVVFLANADQLSALVTLATYDQSTQDNVQIKFGAGCVQSILYSLVDSDAGKNTCMIGLTDPSARNCIDKNVLSFSIPYQRFLEMEEKAAGSFLSKETWNALKERIE